MAASGDDDSFSFCPSEKQLVQRYLRAKLEGRDLANAAYFLDADVCSARPQDLVSTHAKAARVSTKEAGDGQQWFFFSTVRFLHNSTKKRARTIAGTDEKECWHAEGSPKPVDSGGYVQKFSYHVKIGPKTVEKPGWIMAEYGLVDNKDGDTVLSKVYRSPRGPGRSNKRKAADDPVAATSTSTTRRPRHQTEEAGGHDPFPVPVQVQAAAAAAPMFVEPLLHVEEGPPEPLLHAPVFGEVAAHRFGETSTTRGPRRRTDEAQVQQAAAAPSRIEQCPTDYISAGHIEFDRGLCDTLNIDYDHVVPAAHEVEESEAQFMQDFEQYDAAFKEQAMEERHAAVAPEVVAEVMVPQITNETSPTSDAKAKLEELNKMLMAEEDDDGMTLEVPEGEHREAYYAYESLLFSNNEQQDTAIQTVLGPLTDHQFILASATGRFTVDELLIDDGPAMSCPHPCDGGAS